MELLSAVAEATRSLALPGHRVLVAVSGGVDSIALLHALREISDPFDLKLSIGHVNHAIRGAESDADAVFVEDLGRRLDLPVRIRRVDPRAARRGHPSRSRPTLQEAARKLRYAALQGVAAELGVPYVATAHTADDQAETVLLRLLRGTSPEGLGGIPERSTDGQVVRPLLRVGRAQVLDFARKRGLRWREVASHADPHYTRNRLRSRWLPGLAADFNPRLLRAIGDLAEAQRRESEWLNELVEQEAAAHMAWEAPGVLRIDPSPWPALPEALARRLARAALRRCGAGRDVTRRHLERMVAFLRGARVGRAVELPGGLTLLRRPDAFRLGPPPSDPRGSC